MIVTEKEAATKRCQEGFGPPTTDGGMTVSLMGGAVQAFRTAPAYCLGSACMAWRWNDEADFATGTTATFGYCGKAGKP